MRCGAKNASCVPITYFMAGACVVRATAFLQTGGYHARYLIGAEETLVALDLAANGWHLWYDDGVIVRHRPAKITRNAGDRRRLQLRNRLWTMFLRRSPAAVLRAIAAYARGGVNDRVMRRALVEAVAGLPWILRERRQIPAELERRIQTFDHALIP
jgi:GT2 family glycosyltransferase